MKPSESEILSTKDWRDDGFNAAMNHARQLIDGTYKGQEGDDDSEY